MKRKSRIVLGSLLLGGWALFATEVPPAPLDPQEKPCPANGILDVTTALAQTTEIDAPKGQYLFDVKGGDANNWEITAGSENNAKEPPRSLGVMPKTKGAVTLLHLTTNTQEQCTIRLVEITGKEKTFQSRIRLERKDGANETPWREYKWVPAYQLQEAKEQIEKQRSEQERSLAALGQKVQAGIEAYQVKAPYEIKHPYVYDEAKAQRLGIHGIYWIGHLTVIEGEFVKAPDVTERFEGKPKQIDFSVHSGVYLVDTHLTNPFVIADGLKKEHRLEVRLRSTP